MTKTNTYTIQLLLVESCPKKIGRIRQVLDDSKFIYELHVVTDETQTRHFLNRTGNHAHAFVPDAILLTNDSTHELAKKVTGLLHQQVLHLKITDDKIEITKANHQSANSGKLTGYSFGNFLQTILSVKKMADSLMIKSTDNENQNQ